MLRSFLCSLDNKGFTSPELRMESAWVNRNIACLIIAICVSACGAIPPSPESFGKLEVHDSSDGSSLTFASASAFGGGWTMQTRYRLRGSMDKTTRAVSHELYLRIWYNEGGLRNFVTATLPDNREVAVTKYGDEPSYVGRRFGAHEEWLGVPLDEAWLNATRASGFNVLLKAQSGHEVSLSIPAAYVIAYLNAVGALH